MGGAPTIDGGMTEEQYRKLQMEERQFMSEQEERQMMLMNEMEDKRVQREQAEKKRQERLRSKEEEALTDLENTIGNEVKGLDEVAKGEDKDIVMDFYGSLAKNTPGAEGPYRLPDGTMASGREGGGKPSRIPKQGKSKTSGGRPGDRPR